jgi:hypothetical protein
MSCLHKIKCEFLLSTANRLRIFWYFAIVILLKFFHPLKICQHTKFHGSTVTGTIFASTSEVLKSHHHHIQSSVKENYSNVGMFMIFHFIKLCLSAAVRELSPQNKT